MANLSPRVLKPEDLELIYEFSKSRMGNLNDIEKTFAEWKAPWRKESLEHYLKTGWCMGVFSEGDQNLLGYFLAQPFLFTESYTQTLWIEHISYSSQEVGIYILDLSYKYARDKHLQRVLFNKFDLFKEITPPFPIASTQKNYYEVFTAKIQSP